MFVHAMYDILYVWLHIWFYFCMYLYVCMHILMCIYTILLYHSVHILGYNMYVYYVYYYSGDQGSVVYLGYIYSM